MSGSAKLTLSLQVVSLTGLWIIPFGVSIYHSYYRFMGCWTLFSLVTAYIIRLARCKPLGGKTPRSVFLFLWHISKTLSSSDRLTA